MKRTISIMTGKGSINHNSRAFHAENTDPNRTKFNICYVNEDIKEVYHKLFDEAIEKYNKKQTRNDRCINNYYEKIRTGKQEKLFHEIIIQIGDMKNMSSISENGKLAQKILDEYMQSFEKRNPNLYVFSAYLHMDEATPHLHIDFVPFTTGSTRGLETRVSLKKALETQGFKGGTRSENERNQWVFSEKEYLSKIMLNFDIEWEQKGSHEKHLSVLEFEKKERLAEVEQLEEKVAVVQDIITEKEKVITSLKTERVREEKMLNIIKSKKAKVQCLKNIVVKPSIFDNTKIIIDKSNYENIKTLALKQIVSNDNEQELIIKNKALLEKNQKLNNELYQYKSVKNKLTSAGLEVELSNATKKLNKVLEFIESMGLESQLESFLKQEINKSR